MTAKSEFPLSTARPSREDVRLARASSSALGRLRAAPGALTFTVAKGGDEEQLTIPASAVRMLEEILEEMAQGHAVALTPIDQEVTTQAAADLLQVSRPHLVKLLESGAIAFRKTGTHRRVRLGDLVDYKRRKAAESGRAFLDLVREGQELGMGYE